MGDEELKGRPTLAVVQAKDFLLNPNLTMEVFGPFSLIVLCNDEEEMSSIAQSLPGQLTATIIAGKKDLKQFGEIILEFREKAGRLIFNGVPTGVEVCRAMHHGGPFPATTDSRFTAVGEDAIKRWVRPVAYQNCPQKFLPEELKNNNPLKIFRMVNGKLTRKKL